LWEWYFFFIVSPPPLEHVAARLGFFTPNRLGFNLAWLVAVYLTYQLISIPFALPAAKGRFLGVVDGMASLVPLAFVLVVFGKPVLGLYKLNSAIERGPKPWAFGRQPYHWTNTLKAAKVNARRAWKDAQTRCMTFLQWQTSVSIATTVSTRMRSSHSPRRHSVRFARLPSAAGSRRTTRRSSHCRMSP